jgi:hypothetical protein
MHSTSLDLSLLTIKKLMIHNPTLLQPEIVIKLANHYSLVLPYKGYLCFHTFSSTPNPKLPLHKITDILINSTYKTGKSQHIVNVGFRIDEKLSEKMGVFFKKSELGNAYLEQNQEKILDVYHNHILVNNTLDIESFQLITEIVKDLIT